MAVGAAGFPSVESRQAGEDGEVPDGVDSVDVVDSRMEVMTRVMRQGHDELRGGSERAALLLLLLAVRMVGRDR